METLNQKTDETICQKCNGKGYLVNDDGNFIKECECEVKRKSHELAKKVLASSGLESYLKSKTFDNYETKYDWQKDYKQRAIDFVKDPKQGFVFLGQTSLGKTHLMTAMTIRLIAKGYNALYFKWAEQMLYAKNNYWNVDDELLHKLMNVELLYIDDLFKVDSLSNIHAEESRLSFSIIDARLSKPNLITIVSSEWLISDIGNFNGALAGRLVEMCGGIDSKTLINSEYKKEGNWRIK